MGLARKRQRLYELRPDIAVIPECSQACLKLCLKDGYEGRWFGDNPRKGLGVLVAKPFHIRRAQKPRSKWVVPIAITRAAENSASDSATDSGACDFLLVAVWTMPVQGSRLRSYIGQLHEAVARNPRWFASKPAIVCGDFNSNVFWDHTRVKADGSPRGSRVQIDKNSVAKNAGAKKRLGRKKIVNHSAVVSMLEKHRLASAYHHFFSEPQGQETQPTYYFWHHKNRPYHIDYVFLPQHWAAKIKSVELGSHAAWSPLSDHVPLCVEVSTSE